MLIKKNWDNYNYILFAILHTTMTLYSDKEFFNVSVWDYLPTILFCKIWLLVILIVFWRWIFQIISRKEEMAGRILSYSFPYFLFLLVFLFCNHSMKLYGDEFNIYSQAINYNMYPYHFTYLTGLIYILSYMIIPCQIGIVLIKLILQSLVCGYCVHRITNRFGKSGYFIYLLFLLYPVMTYSIEVHRMHFYALLYITVSVKLIFDWLEDKQLTNFDLLTISLGYSILAIWRKEGIYLLVIAPAMICFAYNKFQLKQFLKIIMVFVITFLILYIPQCFSPRGFTSESSHTYNAWFVNMCREGLNKEKYPNQMDAIDKYMSLDAVDYINEELGDENYKDEYIAWRTGYIGIRDEATSSEYKDYVNAVRYLVFKEPVVFLKTRIGLWKYTAGSIDTNSLFNFYKSLTLNLNVPLIAIIAVCVISIYKRKWLFFLISGSVVAHSIVTLIFAPASYFKYYFHFYFLGWLFIIIGFLLFIKKVGENFKVAHGV